MIPQHELAGWCFSERDAILIADDAHVRFLERHANPTWKSCLLLPVSIQALAAALRFGKRVDPHFKHVAFSSWQRAYSGTLLTQSSAWLNELGLSYTVGGIDVPELDKANQFLLFLLGTYLERCTESILQAHSNVETFYVLMGSPPLPLELYLDSDVPASIFRYLLERAGRRFEILEMKDRPYVFPEYRERPELVPEPQVSPEPAAFTGSKCVGFVPATVANPQQFTDAFADLRWDTVVFDSAWYPARISFLGPTMHISFGGRSEETQVLDELCKEVTDHLSRSTLPRALTQNPHLRFQFEYIVKKRWRWYTEKIRAGQQIAAKTPLDLFIHADTFTPEGAILSHFYRKKGTPIVVAAHSGWPCDPNWSARRSSDIAITSSRAAGDWLRRNSGMKSFVVHHRAPVFHSLLRSAGQDPITLKRNQLRGRKLIVLVTNALEVLCVPSVDLACHFETLSAVAQVPLRLRETVLVAIRAKPRPLGEDPAVYSLAGFGEESIGFLAGLSFTQCLRLADCVLGVNTPTTGYMEAMQMGVPLLHVQTAHVLTKQPDLPRELIGSLSADDEIWPSVDRLLFDSKTRKAVLARQRAFVARDRRNSILRGSGSLQQVLPALVNERRFGLRPWGGTSNRPSERSITGSFHPGKIQPAHSGFAGFIDDVLVGSDGSMAVFGWAADLVAKRPARRIHVLYEGQYLGSHEPQQPRPDVEAALHDRSYRWSGFWIQTARLDATPIHDASLGKLSVYAELHDGTAAKLSGSEMAR